MTYLEASLYGALQGLTEFLPVSSSAHLILAPWLLGWKDPGLSFDVALHLGTLAALLIYFFEDWRGLLAGAAKDRRGPEARLLWLLAVSSLPAGAAGLALGRHAESVFRQPARIAWALILFALLMETADRLGRKETPLNSISAKAALGIGLAQSLAIIPGVSRLGATMTAGLFFGLSTEAAARFSFLLGAPVILGAGAWQLRHMRAADISGPFVWGVAVSALASLAALRFFMRQAPRSGLGPYVVYRIALGLLVLAWAAGS